MRRLRVAFNAADLAVYRRIRLMAHRRHRVRWVRFYSRLGEHGMVWLALGCLGSAADAERRGRWVRATVCVGAAYLISTTIKMAIGGKRPSSHSTSSFAAAQAYGRLLPRGPLLGAAAAMAFSRLYLGVHYPSDVAAGAALGTVLGSLGR